MTVYVGSSAVNVYYGSTAISSLYVGTIQSGGSQPETPLTPLAVFAVSGYANTGSRFVMTPHVKGGSGTRTFTVNGTLPTGLLWSTATGSIVGTPTTPGTVSGLTITVTDSSGSSTSNSFSITVGSAATTIVPSGDTTGATDTTAINSALTLGQSVSLSGLYYTNNTILQPANTAIYCNSGEIRLVAGSNCRMWCNTNQGSQTQTDQNISVQGDDNFFWNGQSQLQTRDPSNQRFNHAFDIISARNVKISGIWVNSNASGFMTLGTTYVSLRDIVFQMDNIVNQDGVDVGPGSQWTGISGIRGTTYDDVFSFFAKAAQNSTAMWYGTPWETGANVSNIYVSDVEAGCGLQNMFRLQAGNGFKFDGMYADHIANTRLVDISPDSGRKWLLRFGEAQYLTVQPSPTDYTNIYIDHASGFHRWIACDTACNDVHIRNINQNVYLTQGVGVFDGNNVSRVIQNITVDDVSFSYTGATANGSLVGFVAGSGATPNNITIKNIHLPTLTNIVNSAGAITNLTLENIVIGTVSGTQFVSTNPSTGVLNNVSVGKVQADPGSSGISIGTGVSDMSSVVVTSAAIGQIVEHQPYLVELRANQHVTFSKLSGGDESLFELVGGNTGATIGNVGCQLYLAPRKYDSPQDSNSDNIYVCNLRADDGSGHIVDFTHTVTVKQDNATTWRLHPLVTTYNAQRAQSLSNTRLVTYDNLWRRYLIGRQLLVFCLDRLYLLADEKSSADSLFNIIKPTGTKATVPFGTTFTIDRGHSGDGTTQEISIGETWETSGRFTLNNAIIGVYCNLQGSGTGTKAQLGTDTSGFLQLWASSNSTEDFRVNTSTSQNVRTGTTRVGHRIASRIASNLTRVYYNGISAGSVATASVQLSVGIGKALRASTFYSTDRLAAFWSGAPGVSARSDQFVLDIHSALRNTLLEIGAA